HDALPISFDEKWVWKKSIRFVKRKKIFMSIEETKLKGCFIIEPKLFEDKRGYFFESYNKNNLESRIGKNINFVQDNQSFSKKGVIRAIHYQVGEFSQAKLVRVLHGRVLDVAVDLRKESSTFGQ